jgi:hypothetical protein
MVRSESNIPERIKMNRFEMFIELYQNKDAYAISNIGEKVIFSNDMIVKVSDKLPLSACIPENEIWKIIDTAVYFIMKNSEMIEVSKSEFKEWADTKKNTKGDNLL